MYANYFGLQELPFRMTPDCRFFYGSRTHRKALDYANYGIDKGEGFIVITGEVGAGKTTLIDFLISRIASEQQPIARIASTQLQPHSLLWMVSHAFGLPQEGDNKAEIIANLQAFLSERKHRGMRSLLIVDEAQNLSRESLEELRMLSNFQVDGWPVVQILLAGQPEFRRLLAHRDMERLRQRIIGYHHLGTMNQSETQQYIRHRLQQVGWNDDPHFETESFDEIFSACAGLPPKINSLCDRLLLSCYLDERHEIHPSDVRDVIEELKQEFGAEHEDAPDSLDRPNHGSANGKANVSDLLWVAHQIRDLELELRDMKSRLRKVIARASNWIDDS